MNYNEINKNIGNSKLAKIFGWLFLIAGIMVFISTIVSYFSWNSKKADYNKEYVYSNYGALYYEKEQNNVYVNKIYNTDDEIISVNIPDKETAIMYCSKTNNNECIYFDTNNSVDQSMQNPILGLFATLFLMSLAMFLIPKKRFNKEINEDGEIISEGSSISSIYLFYIFLFVGGIGCIGWQLYNAVNYFNLKNGNNIAIATIYSEIYNVGKSNNNYKPVAYYYVDNQKYIYVNDAYEEGNLEENLGKTFELYYNQNNPNKVSKKKNPVNFLLLLSGIFLSAFTFPFIFFKKKMEKRIDKNLSKQKSNEWEI